MEAKVELYNLDEDPGESVNLSDRIPDVHREFVDLFKKHQR